MNGLFWISGCRLPQSSQSENSISIIKRREQWSGPIRSLTKSLLNPSEAASLLEMDNLVIRKRRF